MCLLCVQCHCLTSLVGSGVTGISSTVGFTVGAVLGAREGFSVGLVDGALLGLFVGFFFGLELGESVGPFDGLVVGMLYEPKKKRQVRRQFDTSYTKQKLSINCMITLCLAPKRAEDWANRKLRVDRLGLLWDSVLV